MLALFTCHLGIDVIDVMKISDKVLHLLAACICILIVIDVEMHCVCAATCAQFSLNGCGRSCSAIRQLLKDNGRRVTAIVCLLIIM